MAKRRATRAARPNRQAVTIAMYERLLHVVEMNHLELRELRKVADASIRRCAELQADLDRLKKRPG